MDARFIATVLLFACALPLAASTAMYAVEWLRSPRSRDVMGHDGRSTPWAGAATPLCFALFFPFAWDGWHWPPFSADQWTAWVALAVGVGGLIGARWFGALPPNARAALAFVAAALVVGVPLRHRILSSWATSEAVAWISLYTALGLAALAASARLCRERGPTAPMLLIPVCVVSAPTWGLTGNVHWAFAAMVLGASLGGAVLVAMVRPRLRLGGIAAGGFGLVVAMIWAQSTALSETPFACNALLCLSMVLAPLSARFDPSRRGGFALGLLRCGLVALPGIVALVVALLNQPADYGA